jgi:hypothetical protein
MTVKITLVFRGTTVRNNVAVAAARAFGFSESWYYPGEDPEAAITAAFQAKDGRAPFVSLRAGLLPQFSTLETVRAQTVSKPGLTAFRDAFLPGPATFNTDVPQLALGCRTRGVNVANKKLFALKNLPDQFCVGGEYTHDRDYDRRVEDFFRALGGFAFRANDLSQLTADVLSILDDGTTTISAPIGLANGDKVNILRALTLERKKRGGVYRVSNVAGGGLTFQIAAWPHGTASGGQARRWNIIYPLCDFGRTFVTRTVSRKVGRPFGEFRGKNSRRQRSSP